MKNRIASLFLAVALMMSLCTLAVARDNPIAVQSGGAERFTDVPASHWAYSYIDKVVGSGLFNGKTPTTFEPSNAMTRSQFVMVMARMEGMSSLEGQYTETKFPDVTPTRRAAGPIAWASAEEQGFVLGFGDGTFKPDSPITRGQFAALIHRYIVAKRYTKLLVVDPEPAQFTDVGSVSPAFTEDVEYARVHGLLTGYSDGTVRASNPITRAAIAAILARFLDLVTDSGYIPLMDGSVSGGDNGDSDNPPVEVPTEYKDIKLVEKNGDHGTTSIVSVTRDGVQVPDPNDLQAGDLVTIRHDPDKGYVVSIRVKDSKNKSVKPVTTKGNLSTFKMPDKNLPVTVTVTYTKESSGGGGGGSSGGGGYTPSYYLSVTANVTPVEGGTVFLTQSVPTVVPATAQATATMSFTSIYQEVAGFAVFVPNTGYEFVSATATGKTFTADDYKKVTLTKAANSTETVEAIYVQISGTGNMDQSNPPAINVAGTFKQSGSQQTTDKTWTVTASGTGAYFNVAKTQQTADATQATATLDFGKVSNDSESVYVAVTPQSGYEFGSAVPTVSGGSFDSNYTTVSDTLRVYKVTKSDFADGANTTTFNMNLSEKQAEQTDETLTYTVKLVIDGKGTVALKAGNKTITEADAGKEISIPLTKSEYTSRYQRSDYLLPVFLTSMPLADNGYKYDGKVDYNGTSKDAKVFAANADTTADTADKLPGPYFAAESGKTYTVTVKFDALVSYGYNLTIIGNETVTADFNGTPVPYKGNADNTPKTYSSGLIVTDNDKVKLTLEGFESSGDAYVKGDCTAEKPIVKRVSDGKTTEETADYNTDITLNPNALTDIVVEIHKTNRELYPFTVKVEKGTTGEVTVKSESGKIYSAKEPLTEATSTNKTVNAGNSGESGKPFYAYEDTVITILPTPSDTVKVKSITVTPYETYTHDVMSTAGYSFQLKSDTSAVVKFGEFNDYSFLLQAPYGSDKSAETHSKNIQKDNTLEQILYSLNNGTSESFKEATSGIENKFGAPTILNMFVQNYLTTAGAGKLKDGSSASGAQILEESLADAIKPNITTIVPNIVEAKKAEITVDKAWMASKLAGYETATSITDTATKNQILSMIPSASSYDASQLTITVTPILTEAKAAEFDIAGQSVQKQMEGFIDEDYLKAIRVKSGYEKELEPSVKVTASTTPSDYTAVISATVKSTSGNWPTLDPSVTMTSYLDKLNIKVAVNVAQENTNLETKVFNSGEIKGYNFTSDIKTVLEIIDGEVSKGWNDTFNGMLKNGELPIDMGMVLSKELLDGVVDQMIQPPSVTLTEKVGSLGDGATTKAAIMDIYRKFVVFDNSNPTERLLYLKTKDDSDNTHVVATINADKNFVLDYDFEKILRDTQQSDKVPYEKLADLILAVRNGMSEDIRITSEKDKNTASQTSQSVIAALIEGRIAHVKATKWGTPVTNWTEVERNEIANLLAAFLMNSETDDEMGDLWADFETSGYTSVEFTFAMDASKRPGLSGFVSAFNKAAEASGNKLTIGFKVEQGFK